MTATTINAARRVRIRITPCGFGSRSTLGVDRRTRNTPGGGLALAPSPSPLFERLLLIVSVVQLEELQQGFCRRPTGTTGERTQGAEEERGCVGVDPQLETEPCMPTN